MAPRAALRLTACSLLVACTTACATSRQLQRSSLRQVRTVADIHQQQVMDNLAMFAHDPNAYPFFSIPEGGSADVTDNGAASTALNWLRTGFDSVGLNLEGSRSIEQGWTLKPVNDPHKLELMRCAYQQAVAGCSYAQRASYCPDCRQLNQDYFGADSRELTPYGDLACAGSCWFKVACSDGAPKHLPCGYVGEHCGVTVWVDTPQGRDELAKLTLQILEFAMYDSLLVAPAQMQVVRYLNAAGQPTTVDKATRVETFSAPRTAVASPTGEGPQGLRSTPGTVGTAEPIPAAPQRQLVPSLFSLPSLNQLERDRELLYQRSRDR